METITNWSLRGDHLEFTMEGKPGDFLCGYLTPLSRCVFTIKKLDVDSREVTLSDGTRYALGAMSQGYREWVNRYIELEAYAIAG